MAMWQELGIIIMYSCIYIYRLQELAGKSVVATLYSECPFLQTWQGLREAVSSHSNSKQIVVVWASLLVGTVATKGRGSSNMLHSYPSIFPLNINLLNTPKQHRSLADAHWWPELPAGHTNYCLCNINRIHNEV